MVLLGLLSASTQAWADSHVGEQQRFKLGNVEFTLGAGLLNGEAEEKVYDVDNGAKVSQLDWQLKQVPTLHLGLSWHPLRWLTLDARGWTQIAKGDSHMKDYDWLGEDDQSWTDYSDHPDTRVQKAWQAEVAATVWALKRDDLALGAVLAYQHSELGWQSRGGSYTYSSDYGYRDLSGEFERGEKGITYQQTYQTPYVGLVGLYSLGNWTLESRVKHSQWVKARDHDQHHMRSLTFSGNHGNRGRMQSLSLGLSYRINPQFSVKAGVDYQVYAEAKGSTRVKHNAGGQSLNIDGKSGSQASRTVLSNLALSYQF